MSALLPLRYFGSARLHLIEHDPVLDLEHHGHRRHVHAGYGPALAGVYTSMVPSLTFSSSATPCKNIASVLTGYLFGAYGNYPLGSRARPLSTPLLR